MPTSILELLLNVGEHTVKTGVDHVAWKAKQGQGPPGLPKIPTLDEALSKRMGQVPDLNAALAQRFGVALPTAPAPVAEAPHNVSAPAPTSPSYSEEFAMGPIGVACWSCTDRHVNTVLVTAEKGAAAKTPAERQEAAATILGEVAVWRRYDLSPDKLARTEPSRRAAVEAATPPMVAAAACLTPPPGDLHLAWAAAGEAERFLRGAPKPLDVAEAEERMADAKGWIGRADTLTMPAEAAPHLRDMRLARQRLAEEAVAGMGLTHAATLQCKDALRAAAVALTPDPGADALARAAEHARAARKAFYGGALGSMKARAATPDRPPTVAMAQEVLSTPRTATVFDRWDAFAQRIGVPVRFRDLGSDYLGLYLPKTPQRGSILLGSAAQSKDALATETLGHELVHAGLHGLTTDIYKSAGHEPQEQEAELASAAAVATLGLPVETWEGLPITHEIPDWSKLRRKVGQPMAGRIEWAANILTMAGEGDESGAYALWQGGPPR